MDEPNSNPQLDNQGTNSNVGYPISPKVKVINNFGGNEFVTLIDEGNGTFSLPDNGGLAKASGHSKKIVQHDNVKNKNIFKENETTEEEDFRPVEDSSALSKLEINGGVHERLTKETSAGKSSISIIISCSTKKIFANPSTTRKLLDNSNFKKYMLGPIEVKGKGKSIKLEVKPEIDIEIGLNNIKQLSNFPVHVWSPKIINIRHKVGVISPIDLLI